MDKTSESIQRKLNNRKRSSEKQCRTPKRTCRENKKEPESSGHTEWIQNTFLHPQNLSNLPQSTTHVVKPCKQTAFASSSSSVCKVEGITSSPLKTPSKFPGNLTSTPVTKKLIKGNSAEVAVDHHDSFNDSDTVFATLDLGSLDSADTSPRRSSRRTPSTYRRNSGGNFHGKSSKLKSKQTPKKLAPKMVCPDDQKNHLGIGEYEELMNGSGDSLFNDSLANLMHENDTCDLVLVDPTPEKMHINIGMRTELLSTQCENDISILTQRITKADVEGPVDQDPSNHSIHSIDSPWADGKRKSIEFRAVSGSQLSFEDENEDKITKNSTIEHNIEVSLEGSNGSKWVNSAAKNPDITDGNHLRNGSKDAIQDSITSGSFMSPKISGASVVTPSSAKSCLLNRFKKNAERSGNPKTPGSRLAERKAQNLKKVLSEAEEERATGTEFDIGPFYGLPSKVPEILARERRINSLYKWQHECLTLDAIRKVKNLIYSLPTSGGKTLVAEILMFRELLCKKKDAILILPFVAIVQEKVKTLAPFALDLDFVVDEYAASKGQIPPRVKRKRKTIFIATIEKASSLINSLIELERIGEIGLVVVDELHMLGEGGGRGAILEMTLTKLIHASSKTQIIGMSATLSNIGDLCRFLGADVYSNDFRPVELKEYVKVEDTIYEVNHQSLVPEDRLSFSRVTTFKYNDEKSRMDPDHLTGLVLEVIPQHSCLVFCPTKKNCENVAELLCKNFSRELVQVKKEEKRILLKSLWREGNGEMCPILRRTVHYGVAYHHSGLTMDERRLIEEAYLDGVLCLLTCTSTLAAGVNLPAKRVVLRSPYIAMNFLSRSQYKQMVGRAGRAGLDTSGESILILPKKDRTKVLDIVSGPCDFCRSSLLYENFKGIRALLLTTIGLKITPTLQSVAEFLQKTLCYIQREHLGVDVLSVAQETLQQLLDMDLILQTVENFSSQGQFISQEYCLEVTRLGRAVYKGSIDIDRGPQLYADLRQAQESLVVANYLHLLYLATPYDMVGDVRPDWMTYLDQISSLEGHELKVLNLIGIPESYIAKRASGQRYNKTVNEFVVNRFYITMILYNLWKQRTIWDISIRFRVPRGQIQNILNGASTFAVCIEHFCQELEEFWVYQDLFTNFVKKLSFCFMMDLIPLLEIPGVKAGRARQLYNAGFKNLQQVAHTDATTLIDAIEHMTKKVANAIITAAKVLLSEKVEALEEEVEQMKSVPSNAEKKQRSDIKNSPLPQFDSQDS